MSTSDPDPGVMRWTLLTHRRKLLSDSRFITEMIIFTWLLLYNFILLDTRTRHMPLLTSFQLGLHCTSCAYRHQWFNTNKKIDLNWPPHTQSLLKPHRSELHRPCLKTTGFPQHRSQHDRRARVRSDVAKLSPNKSERHISRLILRQYCCNWHAQWSIAEVTSTKPSRISLAPSAEIRA